MLAKSHRRHMPKLHMLNTLWSHERTTKTVEYEIHVDLVLTRIAAQDVGTTALPPLMCVEIMRDALKDS